MFMGRRLTQMGADKKNITYREHIVKQGECISNIAYRYGLFPESIWDDPKNSDLLNKRDSPNVLCPGDVIYIREKIIKDEICQTGEFHSFRRKGILNKFRLRLTRKGKPRANEPYLLEIEGVLWNDKTDADGWLEHEIPPNANHGELSLCDGKEVYPIRLRELDPIDTVSGVQARLLNLGFYDGSISGVLDSDTEDAIMAYQKKKGLTENGLYDDPDLRSKLKEDCGS